MAKTLENAMQSANSALDDIDSYVTAIGGWSHPRTEEENNKLAKLLSLARSEVDSVFDLIEEGATPTDEQQFEILSDIDNRYQGFAVMLFSKLADARTAALTVLENLKKIFEGWNLDAELAKRFEFYRQQAQFVVDYADKNEVFIIEKRAAGDVKQGTKENPKWSEIVGYDFWKYPPPKAKTTMWWPWLLAVAVIVGIGYAQTKKDK